MRCARARHFAKHGDRVGGAESCISECDGGEFMFVQAGHRQVWWWREGWRGRMEVSSGWAAAAAVFGPDGIASVLE